jgi:hypothetical protein
VRLESQNNHGMEDRELQSTSRFNDDVEDHENISRADSLDKAQYEFRCVTISLLRPK